MPSPEMLEAEAAEAALTAAQEAVERGEVPTDLIGVDRELPAPVPLSVLQGRPDALTLGDRELTLSPLLWGELDELQRVLNDVPPVLFGAIITDPPEGAPEGGIDWEATATVVKGLIDDPDYTADDARRAFKKLTYTLTPEHRAALAACLVMSLRRNHPEIGVADLVPGMGTRSAVGLIRRLSEISGDWAGDFTAP